MAHTMEKLLKSDGDVVVLKREVYEDMLETIQRQTTEIKALDFRIKTLLAEGN